MKRLHTGLLLTLVFSFFTLTSSAQAFSYDQEWKKVEDFTKKNLPQSALTEVKKIYSQAKKDKKDDQLIKALVYMASLQQESREKNDALSIKELEVELAGSKEPATSILNSLLAELYWSYYSSHRWNYYNRTQTQDFKKDDIATWTAEDFHKKISGLFLQSIKEEKLLQQTKLESFETIIKKGNVRHLRPTLYDLLANRAIDLYFTSDERDINKPAYAFEINQASAFDPAADFIKRKFTTQDSLSLQYKALIVYQRLITFHLNDAKPDALLDADIKRLQYVRSKSVHPDKDALYLNALNHIAQQYPNLPAAAEASYLVALYYETNANTYKAYGDSTHRYDRVKAKEICEKIVAQKDSSEGKTDAINLLNQINTKILQFNVENINVPGQPFRSLVTYRNFNTLYFRLIKADEKLKKAIENRYDDTYWSAIIAAAPLKNWIQSLPATDDIQTHSVEIKVDGLPVGEYLLVAATDKDFSNSKTTIGARLFYVSNISFVNNQEDYYVLNRDNGQPLANASVQIWQQVYNQKTSKNALEKRDLYKTDANGFFHINIKSQSYNPYNFQYLLDVTYNGDHLFMKDLVSNDYYERGDNATIETITKTFLFLDRSIYRPGQTVYFKGIMLSKNSELKKGSVMTGQQRAVYLYGANGDLIDSLKVKTNEFGSFSGKFQLPQTGLNGQFYIRSQNPDTYSYFRVEEYKRPKFYVDYEPVKGTYKVNDKISVIGNAKAYAGNTIDGATVKYRVVRQPRYIYPWLFWRFWQPPSEPLEIVHGEVKTDKDGKFTVEFIAIPDLTINKKFEPVFDYTVYADVTDINGETRSGEKTVTAGYKSLLLKVQVPSTLPSDSLKTLSIRTENMNGQFEPATVKVTISKLKEEKRLIRDRLWDRPDQFLLTKEEYVRNFPYDLYDNETDPHSWEKGEQVLEKTDSVRANSQWSITNQFQAGFYIIEISTRDKNGEEVKDVEYIELYNEKSNQLSKPQYLWTEGAKPIEPGQTTTVKLGTSADNLFIIQERQNPEILKTKDINADYPLGDYSNHANYTYLKLNNERKTIPFTATEADRGGYGMHWLFIKHNRIYQYYQDITVPWTNKELSIEYATYRDKTLPGSEEKWKLKISGYKNEKVAAELLASMYDASLDQFYPHLWERPDVWTEFQGQQLWTSSENFTSVPSFQKMIYPVSLATRKEYDVFVWDTGLAPFYNLLSPPRLMFYRNADVDIAYGTVAQRIESVGNTDLIMEKQQSGEFKIHGSSAKDMDGFFASPTAIPSLNIPATPGQNPTTPGQDPSVQIRKNFNETAFFFPDLRTDSSGAIEFSFTIPEALTKWKFQALAHTKDLSFGYSSKEIVTQKQLMVQPNAPRFLREGDKIEFSSKIVNLTEKELTGIAELQLIDASTNQSVNGLFKNIVPQQYFTVAAGQSEAVKFSIEVPYQFNQALTWRIVAKAGAFSDGEENALPVLTNRMLVTETMPLPMRGAGTKNFSFNKLLQSGKSETLQQYALTVEYTSNPAWYAIQALPYLMEYPYECAEQTWNRYYANSLASFIANSAPRIKQVFERWKITDTTALMSNLQKNPELKSVLLEETPWVLEAKSEAQQKKNLALLFDMIRMSSELNSAYDKLKGKQLGNGGFVWFEGGPDDRYMTQYIVTGIGHLQKLKGVANGQDSKLKEILSTAIPYLDKKLKEDYDGLVKSKTDLKKYSPDYMEIQFLYMRSFFASYPIPAASQKAYAYFKDRAKLTWTQQNKYMQGMTALALSRAGDLQTPAAILRSLKETSINNEELGMYWKDASPSWWWYQAPIERQALLIEAFQEIGKDVKTTDDLKTWLLKNKQTNRWESTKATAEACYALLIQGTQWLNNEPTVTINLGSTVIKSIDQKQEAGTGYFKKTIDGPQVKPEMGNISVTVTPTGTATTSATWGGVYWQYFENLDKITTASTPLSLVKKLFVETNSDRGPVLTPVNDGAILKVGDKIKVRIELRVDREMEYVHMKDMRASCLEPVNVLSSYKWQDGLGYYETTKDASSNFFFSSLRKGTYVFEYPLFVTHAGNFSNGVTTIQSMYAPEFSSHSEGIRINVE